MKKVISLITLFAIVLASFSCFITANAEQTQYVFEGEDLAVKCKKGSYYTGDYKFLTNYIIGNTTYDNMVNDLEIAIHQFAKRQMTWFRGMEKRGFKINWIPFDLEENQFINQAMDLINNF